jgi:hypothetical protein
MSKQQMLISNLISQLGGLGDARMVGLDPGGGGGSVSSVNGKTGAVTLDAEDVGAAPAETVVNVTGTTPTITPADNTIYDCGELASLTISNSPATGKYSIIFYSGATPTTTVGISNFAAEANKRYKITVEDNYATYDSWDWEGV